MSSYDPLLGLIEPTPGDPAVKNAWGSLLNTNFTLIGQAITGDNGYGGGAGGISIAGQTTYTLSATAGSTNQARQLLYPFVGALTGDCTVTIASSVKIGWVLNATTGGHNVILTSGAGVTLTLPPATGWLLFYSDGEGNVTAPQLAAGPQFGDLKDSALGIEGNGWRLCYGQNRPQTDPFWVYMVANSLTGTWGPGFTGSSTYRMPDLRDLVAAGLGNMGGGTRGLLLTAVIGFDPTVLLNGGGSQYAQADTITITNTGSITAASVVTDPGHAHSPTHAPVTNEATPFTLSGSGTVGFDSTASATHTTGVTVATSITNTVTTTATSGLTGTSQNIQPTVMVAKLMFVGA